MMKHLLLLLLISSLTVRSNGENNPRTVINLNGIWDFEQTTKAFPPTSFTRKVPVPGLVHLAEPKIEQYDVFFHRPDKKAEYSNNVVVVNSKGEKKLRINTYNIDYTPRYSWYKKTVFIPKDLENKEGIITLKKSMYVTQVYLNGIDLGSSIACYTPVEYSLRTAIKYGAENEILIKVGDRYWLPSEAAGSYDNEKEHYTPGIWDDVLLSFTDKMRINRLLVLPSVAQKKVTVKVQVRNLNQSQNYNNMSHGEDKTDTVTVEVSLVEKITKKEVAKAKGRVSVIRDNISEFVLDIPLMNFSAWTPDTPFLYEAKVTTKYGKRIISDELSKQFGMRDFTREGKFFYLNGEKCMLRGTNVTLQRFFEDPDCGNLPWDKAWVKKFLIDYPKKLNWNAMRICIGIVPEFWYDLADEYGIMFQNEWFFWQAHGWDEQIRREYTDWVWTDGTHPSIVIWDSMDENWVDYIGNILIPELKKLDPTRIWDAGYMTNDEMDEIHPYNRPKVPYDSFNKNPHQLGKLDFMLPALVKSSKASSPQLVNEYTWSWLWRNGQPTKLTVDVYKYYLGENSTSEQNWQFQAYSTQLDTEWLRSQSYFSGVLALCYLGNNYSYVGDWFMDDIKDLKPSHTLNWFVHAFAPSAVFINLTDERYTKYPPAHKPGSNLQFNLVKVNDLGNPVSGNLSLKILDSNGKSSGKQTMPVNLAAYDRSNLSAEMKMPAKPGGYVLVAEFTPLGSTKPVISRRYLKVGELPEYKYYEIKEESLK